MYKVIRRFKGMGKIWNAGETAPDAETWKNFKRLVAMRYLKFVAEASVESPKPSTAKSSNKKTTKEEVSKENKWEATSTEEPATSSEDKSNQEEASNTEASPVSSSQD